MSIYKKRIHHYYYRKIYQQHFGDIPKDSEGRSYDIHHIDGDPMNNDPSNLIALSIQDHYDLHYKQGDYFAAYLIARKMKLSPNSISESARMAAKEQMKNGHPFSLTGTNHPAYDNTTYTFIHKSNVTETCTQNELRTKYTDVNAGNLSMMLRGKRKTANGWSILKQRN